jgi:predicted kinase
MCGLAFSGKTTLAHAIVGFTGATYLSLDEINRERGLPFGGDGLPVEEWERTHHAAIDRVKHLMPDRASIVVDDTSNLRFLRERFRTVAAEHSYDLVLVYVETTFDEISRRMQENARQEQRRPIRPEVFAEHVRTFERPTEVESAVVYRAGQPVEDWLRAILGPTVHRPAGSARLRT